MVVDFNWLLFAVFCAQGVLLAHYSGQLSALFGGNGEPNGSTTAFRAFKSNYLVVYSLQMRE